MPQRSDDDLLARARLHPDVFGELYARHATAIHAYLGRRIGAAADDLLGEVFTAALSARKRVVPHASGSALPWLYGIAGNVVRDHLRRRRHHDGLLPGSDPAETVDWDAIDSRLDAGARREVLRRVLADLTASQRELLLLVAWDGLTPAEAGQALGLKPAAARARLLRARTRARTSLDVHQSSGLPKEPSR